MPEKFYERPPTVDAQQFLGTVESSDEINAWLSNYGAMVLYDQPRQRLVVQTASGSYLPSVEATDWVLLSPGLSLSVMKDSDFQLKYAQLNPSQPEPEEIPATPPGEEEVPEGPIEEEDPEEIPEEPVEEEQ